LASSTFATPVEAAVGPLTVIDQNQRSFGGPPPRIHAVILAGG
jgi:hypothetical protein